MRKRGKGKRALETQMDSSQVNIIKSTEVPSAVASDLFRTPYLPGNFYRFWHSLQVYVLIQRRKTTNVSTFFPPTGRCSEGLDAFRFFFKLGFGPTLVYQAIRTLG